MGSISQVSGLIIFVFAMVLMLLSSAQAQNDNAIIQYKLPEDVFPTSKYVDFKRISEVEKNIRKVEKKPAIEEEKERLIKFLNLFVEEDNKNEKELYEKYRDAYQIYVTNTKKLNNLLQKLYTFNQESEVLKELKTQLNNDDHELFADSKAADKVEPIIESVHKQTQEDIKQIEEEIRQLRAERPQLRQQYSESIVKYKDDNERRHKYLTHAGKAVDSLVEQYKEYIPAYDNEKTSAKELAQADSDKAQCSSKSQQCSRELRLFSRDLLSAKATLAKREKKLSTDCPQSYTEKQKDDDCPMGQKLVRTFKKYKWKYCPYHTCKPIKCPQNWLDLENAECPVGKVRKPVKRSYYNGRKKCDYFICKEAKNVRAVSAKRTCRATGDPHYRTFHGHYYNFYGKGDYLLALTKGQNFRVDTRLGLCGYGHRTCNRKVAIRLNEEKTYIIKPNRGRCEIVEKETNNVIKPHQLVRIPGGGYIKMTNHRRFKAMSRDGAYIVGRCTHRPRIDLWLNSYGAKFSHGMCVRRRDKRLNVKGLLSNVPKPHNNLKKHNDPWKSQQRKKKAYKLCSQLKDDFLERDCIFDIKETPNSPAEEVFKDYKKFIETVEEDEDDEKVPTNDLIQVLPHSLNRAKDLIQKSGLNLFATPIDCAKAERIRGTHTITKFGQWDYSLSRKSFTIKNRLYGTFFLNKRRQFTIEWHFVDGTNSMDDLFKKTEHGEGGARYNFKVFDENGGLVYSSPKDGNRRWMFSDNMRWRTTKRGRLAHDDGAWGATRTGLLNPEAGNNHYGRPSGLHQNRGWGMQNFHAGDCSQKGLHIDSTRRQGGIASALIYF